MQVGAEAAGVVGGMADEGGEALGEGLFWLPDSQLTRKVSVSASSAASTGSRVMPGFVVAAAAAPVPAATRSLTSKDAVTRHDLQLP